MTGTFSALIARFRARCWVGLAVWAALQAAGAPSRTGWDRDFLIDAWETDHGLPDGSTRPMVQSPDGYLWFGTMGGLVRFDGMEFTVFHPGNTPTLSSAGIINLHLDGAGRLWLSTLRGLLVSEPGRWTEFREERRWTADYVRNFAERGGVLGLTSFKGRVFRAEGQVFEELPKPPGTENKTYFAHVGRNGRVAVVQSGFFGEWDGRQWNASPLMPLVTRNFRGAGRARDGTLLAYNDRELLRIDGEVIVSRTQLEAPVPDAWDLTEDSRGNVWLPTWGTGLWVIAPTGAIRRMTTANGLLADSLRFVFEDREQNLWAGGGNGGGLVRLKHRTVVTYGQESGLTERLVQAVVEESPGKILLGTYGKGLMRLSANRVVPATSGSVKAEELYVQCILIDREGRRWIGTYGGGLRVGTVDDRRGVPKEECGGLNINALFQDSRGRIWIGGGETVSRFESEQFALQRTATDEPMPSVVGFAEDPKDRAIWAANADGLYRFAEGVWREVAGPGGRSIKDTFCLRCDDDGTIWLGGAGGLFRLSAGRWTAIGERQGLPARAVGSMVADNLGFYWLGTNRGLVRVARFDLVRTADGATAVLPHQIFNLSDGLVTLGCSLGFSSTAMRDSAGQIWFATPRGVAVVNPATLRTNSAPPPVVLEKVTYIDGHEKKHALTATAGRPLVLPPGSRKLEAQFAVLSFSAPEKVVLKRRFERDGDLISADRQTSRSLQSDLLVPGNYRMTVSAANNDGVWNEEGVTFAFTVSPFFWETGWFRAGAAVLALGLVGGATWRIQQNRLRHEQEKMARERALAREHALLATVLEGTSDFVAFATPDDVVSFVNPAGRRMAGLGEKEDVAKLKLADFFPAAEADVLLKTAKAHAVQHGNWSGETLLKHRDGREIPVSQVFVVHKNAAGELLFCSTILRDIAGPKQAEQAIRKLNATLEERVGQRTAELAARVAEVERLNGELEAFSYSVSHDLRAPLRNITGFLELLMRRTDSRLDAEGERFVDTVVKEAARMGRLIDDLLAFSRIGRTEFTVRSVAMDELVAEVREELRPAIGARSVVWRIGELPIVKGDRALLRQVFANLLGNAVKFTRGRATAVIEVGTLPAGETGQIVFFVRDNGAGFNAKYADKLFGVFQRLHNQRDFEGTGIGLANVKRIVTRHDGRVWAEGMVDKGATFYFTIPPFTPP